MTTTPVTPNLPGRKDAASDNLAAPPGEISAVVPGRPLRRFRDLPGPRGVPLAGNAFQLDLDTLHLTFERWAAKYGKADGPERQVEDARRRGRGQGAVTRYAAFLRGVSPMNLKMPQLQRALLGAGFGNVRTLLSSGNVVFSGRRASEATIARAVTVAVEKEVGRTFGTIVRTVADLQALLDAEPYKEFELPVGAKRVVTLLRQTTSVASLPLPIARGGAFILGLRGRELLSAYVPSEKGPVFMTLIEKHYGKDVTTRTWDTLKKVARAGAAGQRE